MVNIKPVKMTIMQIQRRINDYPPHFYICFFNPNSFKERSHGQQTQQTNPPVLFSNQQYVGMTIEQFLAHPDFAKYQQEYVDLVDRIIGFVRGNADKIVPALSTSTKDAIQNHFVVLKNQLFNLTTDFFLLISLLCTCPEARARKRDVP